MYTTIFYCLRFETSLFVASYVSQGHGGGIRPRLHMGFFFCPAEQLLQPLGTDPTENTVSTIEACLLNRCIVTVAAQTP
jgi:hypothetical protein